MVTDPVVASEPQVEPPGSVVFRRSAKGILRGIMKASVDGAVASVTFPVKGVLAPGNGLGDESVPESDALSGILSIKNVIVPCYRVRLFVALCLCLFVLLIVEYFFRLFDLVVMPFPRLFDRSRHIIFVMWIGGWIPRFRSDIW